MIYLDCFIQSYKEGTRIRVKTMPGQVVPVLNVECSHRDRERFPVGTIFKADLKLLQSANKKPYLVSRSMKLKVAIEYFDHNLQLQKPFKMQSV